MMGAHHAISGAAAWIAVTSTVPFTLALDPLPVSSVMLGALVTAGAALLPDVDHHSSTIARSGGVITRGVAAVAGAVSGGHRHGMHSILAVAGFTVGTVLASRWETVVPGLGLVPVGSALLLLALVVFASKALQTPRGGAAERWLGAALFVAVVLEVAPEQLAWLPTSVMVGVVVHLIGDMITTGGVPLLWPWVPKPPHAMAAMPVMSTMWKSNGYLAVPVLGHTGSAREWALCAGLSAYTLYGLAATGGLLAVVAG